VSKVWQVFQLGRRDYDSVHKFQKSLVEARIAGKIPDSLVFVEHEPVFTIGKRGTGENILVPQGMLEREGIEVRHIERGGDVTYHGPGQVVGYPIIDLKGYGRDIHNYLRMLEECIIRHIQESGLRGKGRSQRLVWQLENG